MPIAVATVEERMVTQRQLSSYLGKPISEICQNGYVSDAENHGAHFVGHALGYRFGLTCQMMGSHRGPAANVRVPELFGRCPRVGVWSLRPVSLTPCLVFITGASHVNLTSKVMASILRQHVGILLDGFIWHYSNRERTVVRQTPAQFSRHYTAPDNAMFYGSLP
jgi:hypothetical protein